MLLCSWKSVLLPWNAWIKRVVSVWHLQLAFQMEHNLHSENMTVSVKQQNKLKYDDRMEWLDRVPQRSSCEDIPDIRNGIKIFSPVSGWMMACSRERESFLMLSGAKRIRCMKVCFTWTQSWLVIHLPVWSSERPTAKHVRNVLIKRKYS